MMEVASIGAHALVGDCRGSALVADDGTIDWLCWPRLDSPAVFSFLLDCERGGRFRIGPVGRFRSRRRYLPGTNVLETTFVADGAEVKLLDFMPVADEAFKRRHILPDHELLRIARCTRGEMRLELHYDPRADYGVGGRLRSRLGICGLRTRSRQGDWLLRSTTDLRHLDPEGRLRFTLRQGEDAVFSLTYTEEAPAVFVPLEQASAALERTVAWWRRWSGRCRYDGPWREAVERSALALKLLIYAPSGGVVAAPTTSLSEEPGGSLNWDYRFVWLRDAAFVVRCLVGLGFEREAASFASWLLHSTRTTQPQLHVFHDLFGGHGRPERELPLRGYRGARPVRIGNAAHDQLQLDVYGEVIDAVAYYLEGHTRLDRETQQFLRTVGTWVCRHWQQADEGIWEIRSGRRHHTHSRVLCWVALDRLLRLHERGLLRGIPVERFRRNRDLIRAEVERHGWNDALQSYVAVYGGSTVDAALLLLGWYGFEAPDAPRMRSTWRRIRQELGAGPLLYRYRIPESSREGAFLACSFWEVDLLARAGEVGRASEQFEALLGYANDVGLFAEEADPATGEPLGNFPQAFTHVGLIDAALSIYRAREGRLP